MSVKLYDHNGRPVAGSINRLVSRAEVGQATIWVGGRRNFQSFVFDPDFTPQISESVWVVRLFTVNEETTYTLTQEVWNASEDQLKWHELHLVFEDFILPNNFVGGLRKHK